MLFGWVSVISCRSRRSLPTHSWGPVEVDNVSPIRGGTATTNVNLRWNLDEVNISVRKLWASSRRKKRRYLHCQNFSSEINNMSDSRCSLPIPPFHLFMLSPKLFLLLPASCAFIPAIPALLSEPLVFVFFCLSTITLFSFLLPVCWCSPSSRGSPQLNACQSRGCYVKLSNSLSPHFKLPIACS